MPGFELIGTEERQNLNTLLDNGGVFFRHGFDGLRGDRYFVEEFEGAMRAKLNVGFALAVSSGTAALRVALAALGIGRGDEVITSSFTFVATVEAIVESGATPKCAHLDESLSLSVADVESLITPDTKAIIGVHMLGTPFDIEAIYALCKRRKIALIEDTAWGLGAKCGDKYCGTIGDLGILSFDHAKALTTGEGGMVLTNDPSLFAKAKAWHDHGHENNPHLPRWEDSRSSSGFNFRMSELQGAVGLAQLGKLDRVIEAQRQLGLSMEEITLEKGLDPRRYSDWMTPSFDSFIFNTGSRERAQLLRKKLIEFGIGTKILPEAITWHFAGFWDHIAELKHGSGSGLRNYFKKSEENLSSFVSIPLMVRADDNFLDRFERALVTS